MSLPPIISDARFSSLHSDPVRLNKQMLEQRRMKRTDPLPSYSRLQRFARNPKKGGKIIVDDRFKAVVEDDRFQDAAMSRRHVKGAVPSTDRRSTTASTYVLADPKSNQQAPEGDAAAPAHVRKKKGNAKRTEARAAAREATLAGADSAEHSDMHAYEAALGDALEGIDGVIDDADGEDDEAEEHAAAAPRVARSSVEERVSKLALIARGLAEFSDSDASSSEDEMGDLDAEAERLAATVNARTDAIVDPEAPDLDDVAMDTAEGAETARLAIVGLDWEHVRAVDVHAVLASGVPLRGGGAVVRVSIYPSEYGAKRMAEEARQGPTVLLRASAEAAAAAAAAGKQPPAGDDEADPILLRQYELNKLKYYFAVAECDSAATAAAVYDAVDGLELEATSNVMDLRFIPDGTAFSRPPRDVSTAVPADYAAPNFATQALQSSRVELSWDNDEGARSRALQWDRLVPKKPQERKGKGAKQAARKAAAEAAARGLDGDEDDELGDLKAYLASGSEDDDSSDGNDRGAASSKGTKGKVSKGKSARADKEKAARLRAMLLGDGGSVGSLPEDEDDAVEDEEEEGEDEEDEEEEEEEEEDDGEDIAAGVRVRRGRDSQSITISDVTQTKAFAKRAREGALAAEAKAETP